MGYWGSVIQRGLARDQGIVRLDKEDGCRWPSYGWGPQLKRNRHGVFLDRVWPNIRGDGFVCLELGDDVGYLSGSGFSPVAMSTRDFNLASWLDRAFGVRLHVGFPSGRLTNSNVATWVLSNQDSSVAPQTLQDA